MEGVSSEGDGVARDPSGRVVFVRGALPGETVEVTIESTHKRFARASIDTIVEPSAGRRRPPCEHRLEGCGGCGLQHADLELQRALKTRIVRDALERIGRVASPAVQFSGGVDPEGYRTTIRAGVVNGRAGFREHKSHHLIATPDCLVAHPLLREVMADGRFPGADSVFMRVGLHSGEGVAVVDPTRGDATVPHGRLIGRDEIGSATDGTVEERVGDRVFRVSANSFFQSGPAAAELLVATVDAIVADAGGSGTLVDLYCGVGLLIGSVEFEGRRVGVERSASAVRDAQKNLADQGVELVRASVERWHPESANVVLADPSRTGLGNQAVEVIGGTGAQHVVLVSCDSGALGRDAALLSDAGYELVTSQVLDLFPDTAHVEVVSHFTRSA